MATEGRVNNDVPPIYDDTDDSKTDKECLAKNTVVAPTLSSTINVSAILQVPSITKPLDLTSSSKSFPSDNKPFVSSKCSNVAPQTSTEKPTAVQLSKLSSDYKAAHPIGSRKVTENVITYHEPIFQTMANTFFENKKNLSMGKHKVHDDSKEEGSPDKKKLKIDTGSLKKVGETSVKVKKKFSIENIVERIRTEKTQSKDAATVSEESVKIITKDNAQKAEVVEKMNQNEQSKVKTNAKITSNKDISQSNVGQKAKVPQSNVGQKDKVPQSNVGQNDKVLLCHVEKQKHVKKKLDSGNAAMVKSEKYDPLKGKDKISEKLSESVNNPKQAQCQVLKTYMAKEKEENAETLDQIKEKLKNNDSVKKKVNILPDLKEQLKLVVDDKGLESEKERKHDGIEDSITETINYVVQLYTQQPNNVDNKMKEDNAKVTKNVGRSKLVQGQVKYKPKLDKKIEKIVKKRKKPSEENNLEIIENVQKRKKKEKDESKPKRKYTWKNTWKNQKKKSNTEVHNLKVKADKPLLSEKENDGNGNKSEIKTKVKVQDKKVMKEKLEGVSTKQRKVLKEKEKKLKQKKYKPPMIIYKRVKREASLNAAMLVNILYEKEVKVPKISAKRCKSESDISITPVKKMLSSLSVSDVGTKTHVVHSNEQKTETVSTSLSTSKILAPKKEGKMLSPKKDTKMLSQKKETKMLSPKKENTIQSPKKENQMMSPKKESISPKVKLSKEDIVCMKIIKEVSKQDKVSSKTEVLNSHKCNKAQSKIESLSLKKQNKKEITSEVRKVSFSDEHFVTKTRDIQGSKETAHIDVKEMFKPVKSQSRKLTQIKEKEIKSIDKEQKLEEIANRANQYKTEEAKKSKSKLKVKIAQSQQELTDKKKKANLARLNKAKELSKAKQLHFERESQTEKDSETESSDSDESDIDSESEVEETVFHEHNDLEQSSTDITKVRAKHGAHCRAARTHVSVEAKTVFENSSPSSKWCECCQATYYPSQPQQGTNLWRAKQLVDRDSSKSPETIQSSSHHFIAAHTSCDVRPYSSPTHVPLMDTSPYVGQLMSHGHVTCTACGCGHSGMIHTAQCQNYLGGVGNLLPCQRYTAPYSVPYTHGHSSYTAHCGCTSCCTAGSYHHPGGQPLLHQPQMPMSPDTSILLHHPVQLQMSHDASHTVPIQLSHPESPHSSHSIPVQLTTHNESNLQHMSHDCQFSQGEITAIKRSTSQSDQEYIDVGKDDIVKPLPNTTSGILVDNTTGNSKEVKARTSSSTSAKVKFKCSENSSSPKKSKIKDTKLEKKIVEKEKNRKLSVDIQKITTPKGSKTSKGIKYTDTESKSRVKPKDKGHVEKTVVDIEQEYSPIAAHGWTWDGDGVLKKVMNIFDGHIEERKCYSAIRHGDGDFIQIKDCILVCSGNKKKDKPYVAKITNFWEDSKTKEMMMNVLWYYRPEHTEGGSIGEYRDNEVLAAKHRDETLVACIEDRGYVLTYNEYCRFMAEVKRAKQCVPLRKKLVPNSEEAYPSNRIPPVDVDPENVFLCRQVYDIKLKRVLKNPS